MKSSTPAWDSGSGTSRASCSAGCSSILSLALPVRAGTYHRPERTATRTCPLCEADCDRNGACGRGHPLVQVVGTTWSYADFRHNLAVDPNAPVLAWRQGKGKRLGFENSHEAVSWNVFRG